MPVTRRERPEALPAPAPVHEPVYVDKATECHVTPPDVAARMVDYLGEAGDVMTLEPSAGTGSLLQALLNAGQSRFEICAVERHIQLANQLRQTFSNSGIVNRCFLEYAEEARGKVHFPRVIMNPPFRQVRKHIAAALSLMGCNGHPLDRVALVALVPITFEHDQAETMETLGPDTFSTAKVHTKIIRISGADCID